MISTARCRAGRYCKAATKASRTLVRDPTIEAGSAGSVLGYVHSGALRALGVTTAARLNALPDVAPLSDVLPGYEASSWTAIAAPAHTPVEIVETLNREINAALTDPNAKTQLANLGAAALTGTPADFSTFLSAEIGKWRNVVKAANIKLE